ncbi:MAG TPA: outer membrane beta-barrel protein [Candidatus Cryosericum sp.]|nr:outer membrane beta-barrel protein [Candidatus Cryosericum sp.]
MRRFLRVVPVLVVLLVMASAAPVLAQGTQGVRYTGWGVRVGLSADPDQAYGGVHFDLGEFTRDVRFRPTVELGFGDDVLLLQALAEVHYVFSKVQVWKPYVGGGLGLSYADVDDDSDFDDDSDTEVSFAAIGGVETKLKSGNGFMLELKLGFGDNDPDVKFGVGWTF